MAVGKGEGLLDEACQDGGMGGALAVFLVEEAYAVLREGYGADLGGGLYVENAGHGDDFEKVGWGYFLWRLARRRRISAFILAEPEPWSPVM